MIRILPALALLFALTATPAQAEVVLRWAQQGDAITMDPHSQNEGATITMAKQIHDTLVMVAPSMELIPGLATSWELGEASWTFTIREGVTFHDGTPLTSEDVAFSLSRAISETSDMRDLLSSIASVAATGPTTVVVRTHGADPILPRALTQVAIMSKAWAEQHNVTTPQDRGAQQETYAVRHAMGSGPFKLVRREPDVRTELVRHPDWWGWEHPDAGNVDRVLFTPIANSATRVAALLSGELDFVQDPPLQDLPRIRRNPKLTVIEEAENRTIFLGLASGKETLPSSSVEEANPLADIRVRQAMDLAIDRKAIVRVIMRRLAEPAGVIVGPKVRGYTKDLDTVTQPDLERAKALLAEAGYADGFDLTLDCPNDRYVNDEGICQAVVGMLARIGITARLDTKTKTLHFPKIMNRSSDFYMLGWNTATYDALYTLDFLGRSDGSWNAVGFDSEAFDETLRQMGDATDLDKRQDLGAQALTLLREAVVYLPLHHQMLSWVTARDVSIPIQADNQPQLYLAVAER